ncbi:MAG: allantoate amidohydrolase [Pseudomonadota bacterium]
MSGYRKHFIKELEAQFDEQASWVMRACDELGQISQSEDYLDRRYLTKEHRAANALVAFWMQSARMETWQDSVGNIWGRRESRVEGAKSLVFGSHLDTVVNGGKYDGMLGVITPIALIHLLDMFDIELPFHIDIVGFCDEEGTRFGSTLLGSRALACKWQTEWENLKDEQGITLRQAMEAFDLDFDKVVSSTIPRETLLGFVEVHIEQGPVLEQQNLPIGAVTAIAGAKRLQITVEGMAGHAGTVPMQTRQDALTGASEMVLVVEKCAREANVLATVGQISNLPNAVNVIPGKAQFSLDIRSDDDKLRDGCLDAILVQCKEVATRRALSIEINQTHDASAVICSKTITDQLCQASLKNGLTHSNEPFTLLSGAGHDTMAMADICDAGMLFVRCEKGISHHPAEAIQSDDVAATLSVLYEFVKSFNVPALEV